MAEPSTATIQLGSVTLPRTPLVAARAAARRRGAWIRTASIALVGAVFVGWGAWRLLAPTVPAAPTASSGLLVFLIAYAALTAGSLASLRYQRGVDQRLARGLRQRTGRATAVSLRDLLGTRTLVAVAVVYPGGVLLGGTIALVAEHTGDRLVAVGFCLGALAFGGLAASALAGIVRRPTVADDEPSLHADALLRRQDALDVLNQHFALLGAVAAVVTFDRALLAIYLGYFAVATICWLVASWPAPRPSRAEVRRP